MQNTGLARSETGVEYTDSGTQFALVSKVIEPEGTKCIQNVTFYYSDRNERFSKT